MTLPIMQMCSASQAGYDYLYDFEFIKAFTCTYADPVGMLVVGLIVYGGISLSIYIETGQVTIPFVLILTSGGALLAQVAGVATTIATIILLVTGAGGITYAYLRFAR
jgi:hypothetical protein